MYKNLKVSKSNIYILLLPIFLLIFFSCQTFSSKKTIQIEEAHNEFLSFLEQYPDYYPFSHRINFEGIKEHCLILPVSYDHTPDKEHIPGFARFEINDIGPRIFLKNNVLIYLAFVSSAASIKGIEINIIDGSYKYISLNYRREYLPLVEDYHKELNSFQPLGRKFMGYSSLKEYRKLNKEYKLASKNEALYFNPNFYIYEKASNNLGSLESFVIIPRNKDGVLHILKDDFYYIDGYHMVTGLDSKGFDRNGYDTDGYAKHGYNRKGFDREGNHYTGPIGKNGKTGFGTLTWANGEVYRGYFQNNKINGQGVIYGADGAIYAGSFQEGMKYDLGLIISADGTKKLVSWENDDFRVITSSPGQVIEPSGEWAFLGKENRNGLAHGKGDAVGINNGWVISNGLFKKGHLIEGSLLTHNGTSYRGRFSTGLLVEGKIISSNGTVYDGNLKNGIPDGVGQLLNVDGTRYEGDFENGKYEGNGKLTLTNGDMYDGLFQSGLPHGKGIYKNNTERTVESCEFYEGKRVDQVYLMRIAQAERDSKMLAEEERIRQEEEMKRKEDEARRQAAIKAKKNASNNKIFGGLVAGISTMAIGNASGLDSSDSLLLATAVASDVIGETGGANAKIMGDKLVENKKQMQVWESKYGVSDLSYVSNYNAPVSQAPKANNLPIIKSANSQKGVSKIKSQSRASSDSAIITSSSNQVSQSDDPLVTETFRVDINLDLRYSGIGAVIESTKEKAILRAKQTALAEIISDLDGQPYYKPVGTTIKINDLVFSNIKTKYKEAGKINTWAGWIAGLTATYTGKVHKKNNNSPRGVRSN